jgi:FkbM family methyltransferase
VQTGNFPGQKNLQSGGRDKAQKLLCDAFGIDFPYVSMGNIDSLHLFGDTELMILAMYQHNRSRWRKVLDIGANLGLHSIMMNRAGFNVRSFEPDWEHFSQLLDNLKNNGCSSVYPQMSAVHTSDGTANFVRVLNNLTGNHLEGYKASYGPKELCMVPTVDCRPLWAWADFAKIDSEGNEAELCLTMTAEDMSHMDAVLEVRNEKNAYEIYKHFTEIDVPMWSQKMNWQEVNSFSHMPHMNRQGSLFVGHKGPWA